MSGSPFVPLPPLSIAWTRKPVASARTEVRKLDDGRIRLSIIHDVIKGVTPEMLVWWFKNIEGEVEIEGCRLNRYRVWHPIDHIHYRVAKRCADGSIGPGAIFHIVEAFSGRRDWLVDGMTRVDRLDLDGFHHTPMRLGVPFGEASYRWSAVPGGTRYENSLTAGPIWPLFGRVLVPLLRRTMFPDDKAVAWLTHNVEEVGNFESFLPRLFADAVGVNAAPRGPTVA